MTFEKKTFEYVFSSTFSNFKINSCKALIKRLSKRSSKELINKLMIKENKTSFYKNIKQKN